MKTSFLVFLLTFSFSVFSGSVSVNWDSNSTPSHIFFGKNGDINITNHIKENIENKKINETQTDSLIHSNFISITQGCIPNEDRSVEWSCVDSFQISAFEVSNSEYRKFDKNHNSGKNFNDDNQPVVNISKEDIYKYIQWLNKKTDMQYRLPTNNELLYATLAGGTKLVNSCDNGNLANCNTTTKKINSYKPNAWGLFNSVGNVFELTSDNILFGGSYRANEEKNIQKSSDIGFRLAI